MEPLRYRLFARFHLKIMLYLYIYDNDYYSILNFHGVLQVNYLRFVHYFTY